jgi:excisionase family DNA binding protein
MQVKSSQWYRVKAVADMLTVSPATVYRAVTSGALRAIRIGTGTGAGAIRISGEAITAYLAACGQDAATPGQTGDPASSDQVSKAA